MIKHAIPLPVFNHQVLSCSRQRFFRKFKTTPLLKKELEERFKRAGLSEDVAHAAVEGLTEERFTNSWGGDNGL
jgi:hypothetical protein